MQRNADQPEQGLQLQHHHYLFLFFPSGYPGEKSGLKKWTNPSTQKNKCKTRRIVVEKKAQLFLCSVSDSPAGMSPSATSVETSTVAATDATSMPAIPSTPSPG